MDSDSDNNRNDKSEDEEVGKKKGDYFYEHKVPEVDELVMARVNSIDEMGVLCQLLEYNNLEGFLPLSELSRKRMRSVLRVFLYISFSQRNYLFSYLSSMFELAKSKSSKLSE